MIHSIDMRINIAYNIKHKLIALEERERSFKFWIECFQHTMGAHQSFTFVQFYYLQMVIFCILMFSIATFCLQSVALYSSVSAVTVRSFVCILMNHVTISTHTSYVYIILLLSYETFYFLTIPLMKLDSNSEWKRRRRRNKNDWI